MGHQASEHSQAFQQSQALEQSQVFKRPRNQSSPSAAVDDVDYDVFLNHRGPDWKLGFISHLHEALRSAGLHPFSYKISLVKGENAQAASAKALEAAKIHISVVSERFAESKYCLMELVAQLSSGKPVIPVFCGVEPTYLHSAYFHEGPFARAMEEHKFRKVPLELLQEWTDALRKLSNLDGFCLSDYKRDEAELKRQVVDCVLSLMPPKKEVLQVERHLVGLEEHMNTCINKLEETCGSTSLLCLAGTDGIGKTSLAKRIYNHFVGNKERFHAMSFLEIDRNSVLSSMDVGPSLLSKMHKQLLWDLLRVPDSNQQSYRYWFHKLSSQGPILVVLDGIQEKSQFDKLILDKSLLSLGSCIIVTSRNQHLLKVIAKNTNFYLHKVTTLGDEDSEKLFNWHAFGSEEAPENFKSLALDVTKECGGLPLTLKVVGLSLFEEQAGGPAFRSMDEALEVARIHIADFVSKGDEAKVQQQVLNVIMRLMPKNLEKLSIATRSLCLDEVEVHLSDHVAERIIGSKIFVSAGGPQKDFVEKLCEDLREAKLSPFFNEHLHNLSEGEEFGQLVFTATQECELVVVVISEEYFIGNMWQMLALGFIVKSLKYTSRNMKILPLYYGLTCAEFKNPKRRKRWLRVWKEWSKLDKRISLDEWQHALRDLDKRKGVEYVNANEEAIYRKSIINIVGDMLLQEEMVSSASDFSHEPSCHFYENQCRVLEDQLLIAEEVLNKQALPNGVSAADLSWPQSGLKELRRVVKLGKTLIEGCHGEPCHKAYLRQVERTDAFAETLKEIVWCMLTVSYYNTIERLIPFTDKDDFPDGVVPVPRFVAGVGEKEQYLLEKAASADQKKLQASLDLWIRSHSCSSKECGKPLSEQKADSPLMCLAAQILARVSNDKGVTADTDQDVDHISVRLWKTTQEALEDGRQIGKGSFGTVTETTWLGDTYAKKEFQTVPKDFEDEANALAILNHPHIVKVSAYSVGSQTCFFLMEKMPHDLRVYMNERMKSHQGIKTPFTILASIDLMLQISEAMTYMNSLGMVHRDLKPENILVKEVDDPELRKDGFVTAKLADFGLARSKREMTSHLTRENLGTSRWRAPEMFRGAKGVGAKFLPWQADVYSFGILGSEILTGKCPFDNFRPKEHYKLITDLVNPLRPDLPESCPESLASLIRRCWLTDPRRRPTFLEISTSMRDLKGLQLMTAHTQRQDTRNSSWCGLW